MIAARELFSATTTFQLLSLNGTGYLKLKKNNNKKKTENETKNYQLSVVSGLIHE